MKKYLFISVVSFMCMCFVSCKKETILIDPTDPNKEYHYDTEANKSYLYKKLTFTFDENTDIAYGAIDVQKLEGVSMNDGARDIMIWYDKHNGFTIMSPDADFLSNCWSDYISTSKWTKFKNEGPLGISSYNYKSFLDPYAKKTISESELVKAKNLGDQATYGVGTSYGTTLKLNDAAFFETYDGVKGILVLEELYSNAEVLSLYVILP